WGMGKGKRGKGKGERGKGKGKRVRGKGERLNLSKQSGLKPRLLRRKVRRAGSKSPLQNCAFDFRLF
ncbi:hypothetical protein VF11_27875, partial [Nostoc linckia z14]